MPIFDACSMRILIHESSARAPRLTTDRTALFETPHPSDADGIQFRVRRSATPRAIDRAWCDRGACAPAAEWVRP
eukprot:5142399-Prymnesium_polylepis.1